MSEDYSRPNKTASSRGSTKVTSGGHKDPNLKRQRSHSDILRSEPADAAINTAPDVGDVTDKDLVCRSVKAKEIVTMAPLPTQKEVLEFLSSKRSCCSKGTNSHCCIETYFFIKNNDTDDDASYITDSGPTVDTTKLYQFIVALRKITRSKSKEEMEHHIISEVRRCIKGTQERKISPGSGIVSETGSSDPQSSMQFTYQWSVELIKHGACLEGPYLVCREVFAYIWGVSVRQIKNAAETIRESEYGYSRSNKLRSLTDNSRYFEQFSYDEVEATIRENVMFDNELGTFDIDPDLVRAALTPMSESDRFCIDWLNEYEKTVGDADPTSTEYSLNQGTIQNQYTNFYVPAAIKHLNDMHCISRDSEMENDSSELFHAGPVGYSRFCELWRVVFPDLVNRPYRSIMGKCKWCGLIDVGRCQATDGNTLKHFTLAHLLHRATFMKERAGYYQRRKEASSAANMAFPTTMSVIIDLEDSSKTGLPYLAKEATFTHQLEHHLTGAKLHGDHVRFFPTMNTVGKSANLTCFSILRSIEMFHQKHGRFPETIYVQIDGGSENANETVLSLCELIIQKRIGKTLLLCRLPPGHTHDDIDAIFGVIWRWFHRRKVYLTIKEFQEGVANAFRVTSMIIQFEELIYMVPDYESWLASCIDSRLGGLFKEEKTMLCHKFESVVPSHFFPLGVKWTYRAFWSDWVIDFIQKSPDLCVTPIGRFTGLEPVMLLSVWHPTATYDRARPVEGIYCLRNLPAAVERLPAARIKEDCIATMTKTQFEIETSPFFKLEGRNCDAKEWWREWLATAIPPSYDTTEYEHHLRAKGIAQPCRQPLGKFLYDPNWRASVADGATWVQSRRNYIEEDGVPKWIADMGVKGLSISDRYNELQMPIAVSGNSVQSEFNPYPANPRLFTVSGEELDRIIALWDSKWAAVGYYDPLAPGFRDVTKEILLETVNGRKISLSELKFSSVPVSATKAGILTRIKKFDQQFYTYIHRHLSKAESIFINSFLAIENREHWFSSTGSSHRGASSLWSPLQVSKDTIIRIVQSQPLKTVDFEFILQMFTWRDGYIRDHGARRTPPEVYRTSIFRVQSDFVIHMGDLDVGWHRAYIVVPHLSRHVLLVLQASSKTYALLYAVQNSAANDHTRNILSRLFEESNRDLRAQGWKAGQIGPFKNLLKESTTMNSIENKYIGIFITYCIYFLVVDVPVYFDAMDSKLRENLAYHCIVGHLPF